jgi:hypothetical protein
MTAWCGGNEVLKSPLGYIQLVKTGVDSYSAALLNYTDIDLEDPDNAAEAIMSAKSQKLSLQIEGNGHDIYGNRFEWILSGGTSKTVISKHKFYSDAVRALLALSPIDWIAVEDVD